MYHVGRAPPLAVECFFRPGKVKVCFSPTCSRGPLPSIHSPSRLPSFLPSLPIIASIIHHPSPSRSCRWTTSTRRWPRPAAEPRSFPSEARSTSWTASASDPERSTSSNCPGVAALYPTPKPAPIATGVFMCGCLQTVTRYVDAIVRICLQSDTENGSKAASAYLSHEPPCCGWVLRSQGPPVLGMFGLLVASDRPLYRKLSASLMSHSAERYRCRCVRIGARTEEFEGRASLSRLQRSSSRRPLMLIVPTAVLTK